MNIKRTKTADIRVGKADTLRDAGFEPRNIGHRISIVIPEDILMRFRQMAEAKGIGYQTLMNQTLREATLADADSGLGKRVERLEKQVFGKRKTG